jgi:hypothetical protein
MKNLTYDQLIKLAPKDRPFQIEVEMSSGITYDKTKLWAVIYDGNLDTCFETNSFYFWKNDYTGTFTLIDPRYTKPEVLKVGQKVRIMESIFDIASKYDLTALKNDCVGKISIILEVYDTAGGVNYKIDNKDVRHIFLPHYCVMPVEEEEEIQERTLEDILSELSDTDKEIIKSKLK